MGRDAFPMGLFDGSTRDRASLLAQLGPDGISDVPTLSVTLGWSPRRTIRALQTLSEPGGPVAYDPASGAVRARPATPLRRNGGAISSDPGPSRPPQGDLPAEKPGPCPECRATLLPAGTPGAFYCAACGFLETRTTGQGHAVPRPEGGSPPDPAGRLDPRKAQELIAAWVTNQPIPCPNCRRPLDHRGLQSYACAACGESVKFEDSGVSATPRASAAGT